MKLLKIITILLAIICLQGCDSEKNSYNQITPEKANEMIKNNENLLIIDVRQEEEYKTGHLLNSLNIPLEEIKTKFTKITDNKETAILIYCKSGKRAEQASKMLINMGYKEVYTFGGIDSWEYEITEK